MSNAQQEWLTHLSNNHYIPEDHQTYLSGLREQGYQPGIIWDVGSNVLHWYHLAHTIWPQAKIYCFDGNRTCEFLYQQEGVNYHLGVLSNSDRRTVRFWQNSMHPGGSSYYRENPERSLQSEQLYTLDQSLLVSCKTLKTIAHEKQWPTPSLLKIDVQGAELDVLQGMGHLLQQVDHLILELQHVDYNLGAPQASEVVDWLDNMNFQLVQAKFCDNGPDADYHFKRKQV